MISNDFQCTVKDTKKENIIVEVLNIMGWEIRKYYLPKKLDLGFRFLVIPLICDMLLKIKRIKFNTNFIRVKIEDNIEDMCGAYCKYYHTSIVDGLIRYRCTFSALLCRNVSNPSNEINYTYVPTKRKGRI